MNYSRAITRSYLITLTLFVLSMICLCPSLSAEQVSAKVVFNNPSEIEDKEGAIRSYLPEEIKKMHIIDAAGLDIEYDSTRALFYLCQRMKLKPGEVREFKITINDVWRLSQEEIQFSKKELDKRLHSFEGTEDYELAEFYYNKLSAELNEISVMEAEPCKDILKRIEIFRLNKERLKTIRNNVILSKDFRDEAEIEKSLIDFPRSFKFNIVMKNTSEKTPKKETVTYYLPQGIQASYIADLQGFELKYDPEKLQYYVVKNIELQPGEEAKFFIKVHDRWIIPDQKLTNYDTEAKDIVEFLDTTEFKEPSLFLYKEIQRYIIEIKELQSQTMTIKDKVAAFHINSKKEEAIRHNISELKRMSDIMRQRQKSNRIEEILQKLTPDEVMTWRIIYGTIVFLLALSFFTYILWWGQSKQKLNATTEELKAIKKPTTK